MERKVQRIPCNSLHTDVFRSAPKSKLQPLLPLLTHSLRELNYCQADSSYFCLIWIACWPVWLIVQRDSTCSKLHSFPCWIWQTEAECTIFFCTQPNRCKNVITNTSSHTSMACQGKKLGDIMIHIFNFNSQTPISINMFTVVHKCMVRRVNRKKLRIITLLHNSSKLSGWSVPIDFFLGDVVVVHFASVVAMSFSSTTELAENI